MRSYTVIALVLLSLFRCLAMEKNNLRAPGPTFTFGQNILPQGSMVIIETLNYFETMSGSFFDNVHEIIIGITDNFSITGFLPVILRDREKKRTESGLGSLALQIEKALINRQEENFMHLMTLVGTIAFPTTTTKIQTIRSTQAYEFFFGVTNAMLGNGWYWYNSIGGLIHTKRRQRKLRNRFIYDIGAGKIVQQTDRYYYALLIEMNGIYFGTPRAPEETIINRKPLNIILIGPTLRYAGLNKIIQFGLQYPFTQKNVTDAERITFRASIAFAWRF